MGWAGEFVGDEVLAGLEGLFGNGGRGEDGGYCWVFVRMREMGKGGVWGAQLGLMRWSGFFFLWYATQCNAMPWHVWYALGSLPIANSDGRCRSRSALSRLALIRADGSPFLLLLLLLHQHILPSRSNKSDRFSARPFARPIPVQPCTKQAVGEMFRTCDRIKITFPPSPRCNYIRLIQK